MATQSHPSNAYALVCTEGKQTRPTHAPLFVFTEVLSFHGLCSQTCSTSSTALARLSKRKEKRGVSGHARANERSRRSRLEKRQVFVKDQSGFFIEGGKKEGSFKGERRGEESVKERPKCLVKACYGCQER